MQTAQSIFHLLGLQVHINLLNAGLITKPLLGIDGIWADVS